MCTLLGLKVAREQQVQYVKEYISVPAHYVQFVQVQDQSGTAHLDQLNRQLESLCVQQQNLIKENRELRKWQSDVSRRANSENPTIEWLLKFSLTWMSIHRVESVLHYYFKEKSIVPEIDHHKFKSIEFYLTRLPDRLKTRGTFEFLSALRKMKHPKGDLGWSIGALDENQSLVDSLKHFSMWVPISVLEGLLDISTTLADKIADELHQRRLTLWNDEGRRFVQSRIIK